MQGTRQMTDEDDVSPTKCIWQMNWQRMHPWKLGATPKWWKCCLDDLLAWSKCWGHAAMRPCQCLQAFLQPWKAVPNGQHWRMVCCRLHHLPERTRSSIQATVWWSLISRTLTHWHIDADCAAAAGVSNRSFKGSSSPPSWWENHGIH